MFRVVETFFCGCNVSFEIQGWDGGGFLSLSIHSSGDLAGLINRQGGSEESVHAW